MFTSIRTFGWASHDLFLSVSPQEDEWYEQSSDARSQLKFFEQLERMEKQRKDEREREILLRAAKVISQILT